METPEEAALRIVREAIATNAMGHSLYAVDTKTIAVHEPLLSNLRSAAHRVVEHLDTFDKALASFNETKEDRALALLRRVQSQRVGDHAQLQFVVIELDQTAWDSIEALLKED